MQAQSIKFLNKLTYESHLWSLFFLLVSFSMLPLSWLLGSPFQTNLHSSEALRKVWDSLRLLDSDTKKAFEPGRFQFMFNHPLDKIGKSENLSVFANACNPLSAGRSPICFFLCFSCTCLLHSITILLSITLAESQLGVWHPLTAPQEPADQMANKMDLGN